MSHECFVPYECLISHEFVIVCKCSTSHEFVIPYECFISHDFDITYEWDIPHGSWLRSKPIFNEFPGGVPPLASACTCLYECPCVYDFISPFPFYAFVRIRIHFTVSVLCVRAYATSFPVTLLRVCAYATSFTVTVLCVRATYPYAYAAR